MKSEDSIPVLDEKHFSTPNLLSEKRPLEKTIDLSLADISYKFPEVRISGLNRLYHESAEYATIVRTLCTREIINFRERPDGKRVSSSYHNILRTINNPQDVRFRQSAVKELAANVNILGYLKALMNQTELYFHQTTTSRDNVAAECEVSPERVKYFVEGLANLKKQGIKSQPLVRASEWAEDLTKDTLFRELFVKQRKIHNSRLFQVYSERYNRTLAGILKPGVKAEDVFDFISPKIDNYELEVATRRGKIKTIKRGIIKFEDPSDKERAELVLGNARQRMDVVKDISAHLVGVPIYFAMMQLRQFIDGALLHNRMQDAGYDAVFPEILDSSFEFNAKQLLPIRLVLENLYALDWNGEISHSKLCPNNLHFKEGDRLVAIEGPNQRGKSEALRSLHLATGMINAGFSVPTKSLETGIVQASHFISCKGDRGHGGSELMRAITEVINEMEYINPGDRVILDELGDATNRPTSVELGKRILPPLLDNQNQVFATSHHDALTSYIKKELEGRIMTPDPKETGLGVFRIVEKGKERVDFKAGETLDEMKITGALFRNVLRMQKTLKQKYSRIDEIRKAEEETRKQLMENGEIPF